MTTVFFSSGAMGARIIGHNKLAEVDDVQKMTFEFLDKNVWSDDEIPPSMLCTRMGGVNPSSPKILVRGIPNSTKSLIVYFANPSAEQGMGHNHGYIKVITGRDKDTWIIPSVVAQNGDTPSDAPVVLPTGVEMFDGGNTWKRAYSAPCPGSNVRRSFKYTFAIYAVDDNNVVLGEVEDTLGWFNPY